MATFFQFISLYLTILTSQKVYISQFRLSPQNYKFISCNYLFLSYRVSISELRKKDRFVRNSFHSEQIRWSVSCEHTWCSCVVCVCVCVTDRRILDPPGRPCGGRLRAGLVAGRSGPRRPGSPGSRPGTRSVSAGCCTCSWLLHRYTALLRKRPRDPRQITFTPLQDPIRERELVLWL